MTERRETFGSCHPAVNLVYFVLVLGLSMTLLHPVYLTISMVGAAAYGIQCKGGRGMLRTMMFMLPAVLLMAILNPLFNHQGATILGYLFGGRPLTLEAVLYGGVTGILLITVLLWFIGVHAVMTGQKIIYLFGKVVPALSMVIAMILGFVPAFRAKLKEVADAQRVMGGGQELTLTGRIRHGMRLFSIMVTWALEHAVDTADSMTARGYGLPGRTAYTLYRFDSRDGLLLAVMLTCGGVVFGLWLAGQLTYWYFPTVYVGTAGPVQVLGMCAYGVLCGLPSILNVREGRKWRCSQRES